MLVEALVLTVLSVFSECIFRPCTFGEEKKQEPVEQTETIDKPSKNHNKVAKK